MCNIKKFGEVFTPYKIINEDLLTHDIDYANPNLKFCEPCFGNGRILLILKEKLLEYHNEEHIISNMLYGFEIQKDLFNEGLSLVNPNEYKHNFYNISAILFDNWCHRSNSPIVQMFNKMDYVIGNPPYNRNLAAKEEVDFDLWDHSGYTTKLAYCFFIVLANKLLKKGGVIKYVIPCSFTSNENTGLFRAYLRSNFNIKKIKVLHPKAFDDIMIRTCIFEATKGKQNGDFILERNWGGQTYTTTSFYDKFGSIPLFIGDISRSIYTKVLDQCEKTVTAYKGWLGADSYAKLISKDSREFEYRYVHGVDRKGNVIFYSSQCADKFKAKKNKKKNNIGNYNRFHLCKILVNEVLFNSFETKNHFKYILLDKEGNYGASPKNTVLCLDEKEFDGYVKDLLCPTTQMILSVMKDYNHNDSRVFKYIPLGIRNIKLSLEEKEFLSLFEAGDKNTIQNLNDFVFLV